MTLTSTMFAFEGVRTSPRITVPARVKRCIAIAIRATLCMFVCAGIAVGQSLQMEDRSHDNDSPDTTLYALYELFNTGTTSVPLSSVTFRYWFNQDHPADSLVFACDYAAVGCANITQRFVTLATPVAGADMYSQIGFTAAAGMLNGAMNTGEIQTRIFEADFQLLNGAGDYSFISDPSFVYKPTTTVTVYVNGKLVWGVEPSGSPTGGGGTGGGTTGLQVQDRSHDNDSPDTTLYALYELFNTGTTTIPLSAVTFRYWFNQDHPGDSLVFACDYAAVGCANITQKFVPLAPPVTGADMYSQIGFASAAGMLTEGMQTGEIQTRIFEADFQLLNGAGDYSFISDPSFVYKPTQTVTAYINGVLVWGTEPK